MSVDGFNRVAPWYDFIKRLVFRSTILDSQLHFLPALPLSGDFLIIGGGSGEILNPLLRERPSARVWYVEASSEMLARARSNVSSERRECVTFMHGTEDVVPSEQKFDGVITFFFLDLFPEDELNQICLRVNSQLKKTGIWLVSDFHGSGRVWQRVMLWLMYRFFVAMAGIRATKLPAWAKVLRDCGLRDQQSAFFYGGFIKSSVYKKTFSESRRSGG